MKIRISGILALVFAASPFLAQASPTFQELLEETRGGHTFRMKSVDAEGRIYEMGGGVIEPPTDEMSEAERLRIMSAIEENRARLIAEGKLSRVHAKAITNFAWPLRFAAGRTDFDFHAISNYVDENPAFPNQVLDYNCLVRTYDLASGYNHQGTDIYSTPFGWRKMDDEDVVIVAGAPGTIILKSDGNFDRSCAMGNGNWNAVYVQHADGSVAWYGHMKSGSPTVKIVGESVAVGEYLGTVGSSGSSTGPHLHLELYDASNALVDPWLGPCNSKSKQVTWAQQRPYRDTAVNALTVGTAPPSFPACPNDETSFATDYVTPGTTVYFATYLRDQVTGAPVSIRILRPDNSVFAAPAPGGSGDYNSAYWYWYYGNFPNVPGTWTFESTVAGKTYTKTFQVGGSANFGAPASIAMVAGSLQSTPPGMPFASSLRVQVLDSLARPVKGAKVTFTVPTVGATTVLQSRTALTDASGMAAVTAIANHTAGAYSVTASVAGAASPASFSLQNAVAVVNGLSPSPAVLDFGGQSLNTTAPALSVTFTNVTGGLLTVSSVTFAANFSVAHNCTTVAPGASCTASVTFTPTDPGNVAGFLTIQSNAGITNATLMGTGERSLVTHYYHAILNRAPDGPGKAYWESEASRLQGLAVDINETWFVMAGYFFNSAEYLSYNKTNSQFVTDLYNTFFNRAPDGGGLAYWVGQITGGIPREVVLFSFMFSPEFRTFTQGIFGDTAARPEVNVVIDFFRGILNRLPDTPSFQYWLGRMRTAQCGGAGPVYTEVDNSSYNFIFSAEYAARNRNNTQFVTDMYYSFLRRGGDAAGVQYWVNQLNTGAMTVATVRNAFIASPEFGARVNAIIAQGCVP